MKTTRMSIQCAAFLGLLSVTASVRANFVGGVTPGQFGVIDIIPANSSGESNQDSEPSLGLGLNAYFESMVVHTFSIAPDRSWVSYYYTSQSAGEAPWTNHDLPRDSDATLDWNGAKCYLAALFHEMRTIQVYQSPDPTTMPFSMLNQGKLTTANSGPDQPWIKVVNVTNVDHIYIGYNDLGQQKDDGGNGKTASIFYSLDGGATWQSTLIEKLTPGGGLDSPAVRLAISADGKTVYALFERFNASAQGGDDGDVVLMRDDGSGGTGYGALGAGNGVKVADNILLPTANTFLVQQRLGGTCDVAIFPAVPGTVYVAYTELVSQIPIIRVQVSVNSGANFNLVYSVTNASIPELAVTTDGTLGMLYALKNGTDMEVHFLKAFKGSFALTNLNDRTLAKFDAENPFRFNSPYIGDYFNLQAWGYNFYGAFCATGDPQPSHFPSGAVFQRNVKLIVSGQINSNSWLSGPGTLVDLAGQNVPPSIDPFFFYDLAAIYSPRLYFYRPYINIPGDPLSGADRMSWPVLPPSQPQFMLQSTTDLIGGTWSPETARPIIETNGIFVAPLLGAETAKFFRLQQNVASGQFRLFASAGHNGTLAFGTGGPDFLASGGIATNAGFSSQSFTATPSNNYAISKWYLDGVVAQSGGSSFTVSNIASEHTLLVTFSPSNDLAVGVYEAAANDGPTLLGTTNLYVIDIENKGLNGLTGITLSNYFDATSVGFVSATTTQGTINGYAGGGLTVNLGALNPGALATVTVAFVPFLSGSLTDLVEVACSQPEPNLSNNSAAIITPVVDPVLITDQPGSQTVTAGGTATFRVGVSGTQPILYQWFYNATNVLADATNSSLVLTNVTATQSGDYSVSVFQNLGPEDIQDDNSDPATLTVQ
jgi:hypothetical protein